MENKEFLIELNTHESSETKELLNLIRSYNLKGLMIEGQNEKPQLGEMAGAELSNILTVVLSSAAISVSLKGLFDLLKTYFITKRNKEIKIKYKDLEIELNNFGNQELTDFIQLLNK